MVTVLQIPLVQSNIVVINQTATIAARSLLQPPSPTELKQTVSLLPTSDHKGERQIGINSISFRIKAEDAAILTMSPASLFSFWTLCQVRESYCQGREEMESPPMLVGVPLGGCCFQITKCEIKVMITMSKRL